MYQVIKRNDKTVSFDLKKISQAIRKAFDAQNKQYNDETIDFLALKVTADFEPKIKDGKIAESGTHEELMAFKGAYYRMYQVQSYYYKENGGDAE